MVRIRSLQRRPWPPSPAPSTRPCFRPVPLSPESKIKPEIFAANDHVDQLIAAVKTATKQLVPAVRTGDKAAISAAYTAVYNACNACHKEFRREE
jgi:cytochrome c556